MKLFTPSSGLVFLSCILSCTVLLSCSKPEESKKPEENAKSRQWMLFHELVISPTEPPVNRSDLYFLGEDTLLAGRTYNPIICWENADSSRARKMEYALRQDQDQVYAYDLSTKTEFLLFDFSLEEGQLWETKWLDNSNSPIFEVLTTGDSILQGDNVSRKFVRVRDTRSGRVDYWFKGIGSVTWGILWMKDWEIAGVHYHLLCYHEKDKLCYQNPDYSRCYYEENTKDVD